MSDQHIRKSNKSLHLHPIILNLPPKNSLVQLASISNHSALYQSKITEELVESTEIYLQKTQVLSNLEIYQWRHNTEFPIPKAKYVRIEQSENEHRETILTIFHEYFPHSFTYIHEVSLSQTLYLLRESMIGLQILYSKFGGFEINEAMIAINEKGFCKIWINENFALNSVQNTSTQESMIKSLKEIFRSRCQESKMSKKLFEKLENETTFVKCLIELESFISNEKMIVPCRFVFSFPQEPSRFSYLQNETKNTQPETFNHNYYYKVSCMKVSDGETAYTRNHKETSNSRTVAFGSPREEGFKEEKYMNESYFSIEMHHQRTEKKNIFGSETLIKSQNGPTTALSSNTNSQNAFLNIINPTSDLNNLKNENILHENEKSSEFIKTPRSKAEEEEEEEKVIREEHTDNVMKNNGWNNCANILDVHSELNESFNEGKEEVVRKEPIFLAKLDNIGRRSVAMSLLPEENEDII